MRRHHHRLFIGLVLAVLAVLVLPRSASAVDPNPGVNDQPDVILAGSIATTPGTAVAIPVSVVDPDEHLLDMEMEIDISDVDGVGGRSVPAGDYGTFSWGFGTDVTSDIEVEPEASLNTALGSFMYTPPDGFSGLARIVFEIDDQGNVGTGGVLSQTRFININVAAPGDPDPDVNDPPDITLPGTQTTGIDTPTSFAPVLSDPDVGPFDMEMEIDISDLDGVGPLSVPAGDYGTFSWGGGSGLTSEIELDSLADLNTFLSTFTYTPPPGFTGLARIVFEIDDQGNTGEEFPPNVLSRTRFIDINVVDGADLGVTKDCQPTVNEGELITCTVTVVNNGPADAQNAVLTDVIPTGAPTSFANVSGPVFTLGFNGSDTWTATRATFAAGATSVFTVTFPASLGTGGTTLTNNASVVTTTTDLVSGNNAASDGTLVLGPDLSVAKTAAGTVIAGETLTYTLTVTNSGPGAAAGVSLSDPLPAGTTFVSALQTAGPSASLITPAVGSTGTVTANIASLAASGTMTFEITVEVDGATVDGSVITNTATLDTDSTDPDLSDNVDSVDTTVGNQADLSVTKTADATVIDSEDLAYTITVTNDGPAAAQNVVMNDVLPDGTTFVSLVQESGPAATLATPAVGGTGTVTASWASLANGASATFTLVVGTDGTGGTEIVNTATVESATVEADDTDNEATAATQSEIGEADLAITKTAADAEVTAGAELVYTIEVVNDGPFDADEVAITDSLPESTTFVSLEQESGPDATCDVPEVGATGMIECTIETLEDGVEATFTLVVRLDADVPAGTTISNTATVASVNVDPVSDNSSTADATVLGVAATALDPISPALGAAQPAAAVVTATQPLPASGRDLDLQVVVALLLVVGGGGFLMASRQHMVLARRRIRAPRR